MDRVQQLKRRGRGTATAEAAYAHSVHADIRGLPPGRSWWYRFVSGDAASPVGRAMTTVPAGTMGNDREFKIVNERWYSDDLQVLLKSTNSDPRFGVTTYELANIVRAEPDPAIFLVPSDYGLKN